MNIPVHIKINNIKLFVLLLLIIPKWVMSQVGLRTPIPYYDLSRSDSLQIIFPTPVVPMRDWDDTSDQFIQLENETGGLRIDQIISPNLMPDNPFGIDTRSNSHYVPRMVRDELNLIMNRPRDNAFVPILPVAYLALQLAGKYLIIKQKTEITADDINNADEALPILKELWLDSPLTLPDIYKKQGINPNYTMVELKRLIDLLSENKLVRPKQVENGETIYFWAIDQPQYEHILEKVNAVNAQSELQSKRQQKSMNVDDR